MLVASKALGIGAASFASGCWKRGSGTRFGNEGVFRARRRLSEQRYSGKPDGDSRNAIKSQQTTDYSQQTLGMQKSLYTTKNININQEKFINFM